MKKIYHILFFLWLCPFIAFGFKDNTNLAKVDSLKKLLDPKVLDTNQANYNNQLSELYRNIDYLIAEKYADKGLEISEKINFNQGIADAYYNLGYAVYYTVDIKTSLEYYYKALKGYRKTGDKISEGVMLNDIAYILTDLGQYERAIEYLLQAESLYRGLKSYQELAIIYHNIGHKMGIMGDLDKSMEYYHKSLETHRLDKDTTRASVTYTNLGQCYLQKKDTARGLKYLRIGLKTANEKNYSFAITTANNAFGHYYLNTGNYKKARLYYLTSLTINKNLNNLEGIALTLTNLASIDYHTNDLDSAEARALKAYRICKNFNLMERQQTLAELLSRIYYKKGDHQQAFDYLQWYVRSKDSLLNINVTRQIEELEGKYENKKKEGEIKELKLAQSRKDAQIKQKEIEEFYLFIALSLSLAVLGIGIFAFIQKRKSTLKLEQSHALISEKNEELNQQNEEILAQRDEIERHKDELELKSHDVQESITAAERIQRAFFQSEEREKALLPQHFVIFKPRDVVSGDFYWSHIVETSAKKYTYISVVDCTGHGIPGAVMSMLGLSLIKEVLSKTNTPTPAQVLDNLRKFLIRELAMEGKESEVKEGMDMAIIRVDHSRHEILYAGANNPVYLSDGEEIKIYKANKQSISYNEHPVPFENKVIEFDKGNMIYLFSDGYPDQFGGKKGKKLGYKKFRELLLEISEKPVPEQQKYLEDFFMQWKNSEDQVDDVCVFGVKL